MYPWIRRQFEHTDLLICEHLDFQVRGYLEFIRRGTLCTAMSIRECVCILCVVGISAYHRINIRMQIYESVFMRTIYVYTLCDKVDK